MNVLMDDDHAMFLQGMKNLLRVPVPLSEVMLELDPHALAAAD